MELMNTSISGIRVIMAGFIPFILSSACQDGGKEGDADGTDGEDGEEGVESVELPGDGDVMPELPGCGDEVCNGDETCTSCTQDCGPCQSGTTYFVATAGCSDSYPGTRELPWCTIQKAADTLQPGDTAHVLPGIYFERVTVRTSGTSESSRITIEGEPGAIVDGSELVTGWTADPGTSPPCPPDCDVFTYKTAAPFNVYAMTIDDKDVPRLGWPPGSEYEGYTYLRIPPDETVVTEYEGLSVNYWDGIEALYYPVTDEETGLGDLYLRLRGGEDPSGRVVRISPGCTGSLTCAGFTLEDKSYVTVRNFTIRAARYAVYILGSGSRHNVIEGNVMPSGQKRVYLRDGAALNEVRGNEMFMDGLSEFKPGGWNGARNLPDPAERYDHGVKEHIYWVYKHEVGNGSTYSLDDDSGVGLWYAGGGNAVHHNHIHDTLGAVDLIADDTRPLEGARIYANELHGTSSVGIGLGRYQVDVEIFENLIYDANACFRVQDMDDGNRRIYVYRNRFYNPHRESDNNYYHWEPGTIPDSTAELWIYQNTFVGALWGMEFAYEEDDGLMASTFFVNNVYSTSPTSTLIDNPPATLGAFDYNWAGGVYPDPLPSWFGAHNVGAPGLELWADETMPDFVLPPGSAAQDHGLDLSAPFELGGLSHPALPGLEGTYCDAAPDIGAVQDCP